MLAAIKEWRHGVRLYIAIGVLLVTLETWWWASASYGGSILFATRMEEVFAWIATAMIGLAVSIGPIYKIWPRIPGKAIMSDARRLIGVGAAWFASLHVVIAYDSLFKFANPLSLPQGYQRSFLVGSVALVVLLAMAFTSFDRAFRSMGIWWFRLHRFVYLALLAILLHAFMTGAHATNSLALGLLTAAALFILLMHAYLAFIRASSPTRWQLITLSFSALALIAIFNYGYRHNQSYTPAAGKTSSLQP